MESRVLRRPFRLTALLAALGALLLLAFATGASATVISSKVTSPVDGSYFLEDSTGSASEITISGTIKTNKAIGEEEPEINCYSGSESTYVAEVEEEDIKKTGTNEYKFTVKEVPVEEFGEEPCILRVVPEGYAGNPLPAGAVTPFEGSRVAYSEFGLDPGVGPAHYGFELQDRTLSSIFEIESAGQGGLSQTYEKAALLSSPALTPSAPIYASLGALWGNVGSRSAIQVDGHNAYDTAAAQEVKSSAAPSNAPPSVEVTHTFNAATGLMTINETDPLVECTGKTVAFPDTKESCEEFVSAGIALKRSWTPTEGGRLITMTDSWSSTDGKAHTLSVLYAHELAAAAVAQGTYEFPGGAASFGTTKTGESIAVTAGEGAILYREDGEAAETIGGPHPVAAIAFDTTPSGPLEVSTGSAGASASEFQMPYDLEVPASGERSVTMAFAQGYTLAEVGALAEQSKLAWQPSVAITSPMSGSTTGSASLTVSGTASSQLFLGSLTVNGQAVGVTAGHWSTNVALTPGENTITAVATNKAGLSRTATSSVFYTPPAPAEEAHTTPTGPAGPTPGAPAATAIASRVGAARLLKGNVTVVVACNGPAGTRCALKAALTTVERLRGGHPSALSASAAAARSKRVTVGSVAATLAAGTRQTITIRLNATGRALLARFHKLPARLAVVQQDVAKAAASILAQTLTITAKHR